MEFVNFEVKQEYFYSEDEQPGSSQNPEEQFHLNGVDPLITLPQRNQRGKFTRARGGKAVSRGKVVSRGRGAYIIKTTTPSVRPTAQIVHKPQSNFMIPKIYHPAVRMIDLNLIAHSLWCNRCNLPLSLRHCVSDNSNTCRSLLQVRCLKCVNIVPITLSLLDANGDCAPYCSSLITKDSKLDYKLLAERCMEVGMQLDLLNSMVPRPDNRGRSKPTPAIEIPDDKILTVFRKDKFAMSRCAPTSTISSAQHAAVDDYIDVNMFLEGPKLKLEPTTEVAEDLELANTSQDSDLPDFEEHMEGEIEDLISDPEEEQPKKKRKNSSEDDWKPGSETDEVDSWAEDEDEKEENKDGILAANKIKDDFAPVIMEKCLYCDLKFPNFMKARKHMENTHIEFKQLKCGGCQRQFDLKEPFKNHVINYHRDSKSKLCPHCGKMCSTSGALASHIISHKTEATIPCPKCPKLLKSNTHLYRHMAMHQMTYTCDLCHKKIRKRSRLIEHMNLHIENKTHDCEICGAKFLRKDNRKTHMKNNHNWICLVCNGKFLMMEEVSMHVKEQHSEDQVVEALGKGVVPYEKVTRFQCPTCLRFLASKQSLEFHMITHTGEGRRRGRKKPSS